MAKKRPGPPRKLTKEERAARHEARYGPKKNKKLRKINDLEKKFCSMRQKPNTTFWNR